MLKINTLVIILIFVIALVIPTIMFALAKNIPIVIDMQNAPKLPHQFRTTAELPKLKNVNWQGFKALKMCGSGQFSKMALDEILNQLHTKKLMVIDLRQESHGFLNGNAITWYGIGAAENKNKSDEAIEQDQAKRLSALAKNDQVVVHKIMEKTEEGRIHTTKPIEFAVHRVESEKDFVESLGLQYVRIYVQNFYAPSPKQVDRFLEIIQQIPEHQWVYFHCRAGIGRTSIFMMMYDMLHNAKTVSFQDFIARQVAIGGKNLALLPARKSFKYRAAKKRLAFLQEFYNYARQNEDNFKTPFSVWLSEQSG